MFPQHSNVQRVIKLRNNLESSTRNLRLFLFAYDGFLFENKKTIFNPKSAHLFL